MIQNHASSSNWFTKWELDSQLPSQEDLIPLSQSLITQDLAIAFNIHQSNEFDSPEMSSGAGAGGSGGATGSDEPARTLKRPRLVWTPQLHKRFVDAVAHLGIKNAVPKTIMQLMSVDGLTRENVASHLQKYRLYLKRMQGISTNNSGSNSGIMDTATDRLFASSPVPAHFLNPIRANSEHFLPFVGPTPVVHPHQQYRHFGNSAVNNGQFDHPFMRQGRIGNNGSGLAHPPYVEDLESNGRKILTLFPTRDD